MKIKIQIVIDFRDTAHCLLGESNESPASHVIDARPSAAYNIDTYSRGDLLNNILIGQWLGASESKK